MFAGDQSPAVLFHIQLTGTKYLTRKSLLEPNKTPRALYTWLTDAHSFHAATAWQQHFYTYYQARRQFLKHHSYLHSAVGNWPKSLRTGQTSWYIHKDTRSAYFALKRLVTNDRIFIGLAARTCQDEQLSRNTSRLEGQYNKPIKDPTRVHCGMSEPRATVAIAWFLYLRAENAR